MKAYGVNEFGHGYERRANTFRKATRRTALRRVDKKRARTQDRRAFMAELAGQAA